MITTSVLEFIVDDTLADGGGIRVTGKDLSSGPDGVVHASSAMHKAKRTGGNHPDSSAVSRQMKMWVNVWITEAYLVRLEQRCWRAECHGVCWGTFLPHQDCDGMRWRQQVRRRNVG